MVVDPITSLSGNLLLQLGHLGLWLQALGVALILSILFDIVSFVINRKRIKEIHLIKQDIERIEDKIDKIISKKK